MDLEMCRIAVEKNVIFFVFLEKSACIFISNLIQFILLWVYEAQYI